MTEAGKRLLTLYSRAPGPIRDLADGIEAAGRAALTVDIAAIEAEAVAAERARIRAGVNGLWNGLETWGPDEFWVDGEPYVRAAAVQRIVDGAE
jgi:hypothetical protein